MFGERFGEGEVFFAAGGVEDLLRGLLDCGFELISRISMAHGRSLPRVVKYDWDDLRRLVV